MYNIKGTIKGSESMVDSRKPGDFTGLAQNYTENRPDYSPSVLTSLIALVDKKKEKLILLI